MKDYIEDHELFNWKYLGSGFPKRYRKKDPETSKKAYKNSKIRHGSQQHKLLQEYYRKSLEQEFPTLGLTDEEAGIRTGLAQKPRCCYWKRCSELRELDLIMWNGQKRMSSANEYQAVSIITNEGIEMIKKAC